MYGSKVSLLAFFSESVIDRLNVKLDVGSRDCKYIIIRSNSKNSKDTIGKQKANVKQGEL